VLRKGPEEFERVAKMQASARLASKAGRIDPFARHTSGNDNLERELFEPRIPAGQAPSDVREASRMKPGEITPIIETPEGYVVARLLRRIPAEAPPQGPAEAAAERARWEAEILEKKARLQIPAEFAKLRAAAAPNIVLQPTLREEDWMREVKKEISAAGPEAPRPPKN
jgi:hypothetical protein